MFCIFGQVVIYLNVLELLQVNQKVVFLLLLLDHYHYYRYYVIVIFITQVAEIWVMCFSYKNWNYEKNLIFFKCFINQFYSSQI